MAQISYSLSTLLGVTNCISLVALCAFVWVWHQFRAVFLHVWGVNKLHEFGRIVCSALIVYSFFGGFWCP